MKESAKMAAKRRHRDAGFTLLETMIAMVVLLVGVLGLAMMLGTSLAYMQGSEDDFIAQQKAQEAMESIFTAKYSGNLQWSQIQNTPNGIFLTGAQPLLQPGTDGLVGTAADSGSAAEYILQPGPDMKLGTSDDIKLPLSNFTRTITITPVINEVYVEQITVTINYQTGLFTRTYTLNSEISAF
jgi:prepilin-type N-terminal cleavage/methylation domain-containing protein